MSYVDKTLLPDETVLYQAQLHWFRYLQCGLLAAAGAALISYDTYDATVHMLGFALLCAAPVLAAKAWFDQVTSEFALTQNRVLIKAGFIRRRSLELRLTQVESVGVDQSVLGRVFGYGTIIVSGTGGTRERFSDIADPLEFRWHVQAIGSGDYDAIRHRKAERDALDAQPLSKRADKRLKLGVVSLFAALAVAVWVYVSWRGSDDAPTDAVQNASAHTDRANAKPMQAEAAAQNQGWNDQDAVSTDISALPGYDIANYCSNVSNTVGGSFMIEKSCRDQEALAAQALADMSIPQRIASYCDQISETTGGSYVIYKTCVEQELHAAAQM